jgi:hypothetical protein
MDNKSRHAQLGNRRKNTVARLIAFAVIVLLVLGAAGYLVAAAFSPRTPPPPANVIDVSADMGGFSRNEIRVKAGQPVTVRLTSLLLHAHDGHKMAMMLSGQADAQGVFRFEGLENKPGRTFDIMAIVGPTVYSAEQISPQSGQSEYKAAITIYGTNRDTSKRRAERSHNFVEFINRQQVRTTEIYVLSNSSDRTVLAAGV